MKIFFTALMIGLTCSMIYGSELTDKMQKKIDEEKSFIEKNEEDLKKNGIIISMVVTDSKVKYTWKKTGKELDDKLTESLIDLLIMKRQTVQYMENRLETLKREEATEQEKTKAEELKKIEKEANEESKAEAAAEEDLKKIMKSDMKKSNKKTSKSKPNTIKKK